MTLDRRIVVRAMGCLLLCGTGISGAGAAEWAWNTSNVHLAQPTANALHWSSSGAFWASVVNSSTGRRLVAGRLQSGVASVDLDLPEGANRFVWLVEDVDHVVHLRSLAHAFFWNGNQWQAESRGVELSTGVAYLTSAFGADGVGGQHFAYGHSGEVVYASALSGVWTSTSAIPLDEASQSWVDLSVTTSGIPYAALSTPPFYFGTTTRKVTVKRRVAGVWQTVVNAGPGISAEVTVDGNGRIHLWYMDTTGTSSGIYRRYAGNGALEVSTTLPSGGVFIDGPGGQVHWLQSGVDLALADGTSVALPILGVQSAAYLSDGSAYYLGLRNEFSPEDGSLIPSLAVGARVLRPDPPTVTSEADGVLRAVWSTFSSPSLRGWRLHALGGPSEDYSLDADGGMLSGLPPNARQEVVVEGLYDGFPMASSPTVVHTRAAPPGGPLLTPIAGGVHVGWTANGNPPATRYRVQAIGPSGAGAPADVVDTAAVLLLDPAQPHALRLSAVNGDGLESAGGRFRLWRDDRTMVFDLLDGSTVSVTLRGAGAPSVLAWTSSAASDLPVGWSSVGVASALRLSSDPPSGGSLTLEIASSLIDGPSDRLALARREAGGGWVILPGGGEAGRAWGETDRGGDFAVLRRDSPSSATPRATPNPFRPGDGRELVLSGGVERFEVYTLSGRRVRTAVGARWDGNGDDGRRAERGVYVIRGEGPAGRARFKVLVE